MPGLYNNRVMLQVKEKTHDTGLEKQYHWVDIRPLKCDKANISVSARANFQQLGHPDVSMYLQFQGEVKINFDKHRFKDYNKNEIYLPVAPASYLGILNRITRIYVSKELIKSAERDDSSQINY